MSVDVEPEASRDQVVSRAPAPGWVYPGEERDRRNLRRGLAWGFGSVVAFAAYTWLAVQWKPIIGFDSWIAEDRHFYAIFPVLRALNHIGQRMFCLPVLGLVLVAVLWRHRVIRPLVASAAAVFVNNLAVLILKVWLGRGMPLHVRPEFFIGGQEYPSGHTANIIVVFGLCVYLLSRYELVGEKGTRRMMWALGGLSLLMIFVSLFLRWHWLSDLIAGYFIGGGILGLAVALDAWMSSRARRLAAQEARLSDPPQGRGGVGGGAATSPRASSGHRRTAVRPGGRARRSPPPRRR